MAKAWPNWLPSRRRVALLLRLALGAIFIYAGALKLQDPGGFADSIASFQLLPRAVIAPFALSLPFFEILAGILVLGGPWKRSGALAIVVLAATFCLALSVALIRGLDVDCGCFGQHGTPTSPWMDLARDLVLLAAAVLTLAWSGARADRSTAPDR